MKKKQEQVPLKIILQNFLNHIEHLETQGIEDIYEKNFQELKLLSEKLKSLKECSCSEGENEVNRKKNRYKDILPFDSSRVKLSEYVGVPGSNYINANFIRGASGSPAYIASQGPLPHTVNDFWRMVVEWDVQVIVMACSVEEAGKHKCEKYWVDHENEEKEFGNVKIRLVKASVICPDYLVRTMLIKYKSLNNNEIEVERKVCQYHYVAWPDHGVPSKVRPLVDMVRKVRETQVSETVPVLVHCSAGCGRTGTICAIDYVWGLLRSGKLSKDFSLFKLVQSMRKQRIAMVQTKEQYILVHQAVRELFNDQLRVIESHPYENIDINGMPLVKAEELAHASIYSENTVEEKQDIEEKEVLIKTNDNNAPFIPQRKKSHTAFSKHEKEVENLTEKQRSMVEYSSESDTSSALSTSSNHKPRIEKLKALFECNSSRESRSTQNKVKAPQQITRSHSIGAIRKLEKLKCVALTQSEVEKQISRPIPSQGTLRVPHLHTIQAPLSSSGCRPLLPVKRSKSLKVLSCGERSKLSLVSTIKSFPFQSKGGQGNSSNLAISSSYETNSCNLSFDKNTDIKKPVVPPKSVSSNEVSNKSGIADVQNGNNSFRNATNDISKVNKTSQYRFSLPRRHSLESITAEDLASSSYDYQFLSHPTYTPANSKDRINYVEKKTLEMNHNGRHESDEASLYNTSMHNTTLKDVIKSKVSKNVLKNEFQNLSVEAQKRINAIVAGLGVRERRNSFCRAVNTNFDSDSKVNPYEPIWPSNIKQCLPLDEKKKFALAHPPRHSYSETLKSYQSSNKTISQGLHSETHKTIKSSGQSSNYFRRYFDKNPNSKTNDKIVSNSNDSETKFRLENLQKDASKHHLQTTQYLSPGSKPNPIIAGNNTKLKEGIPIIKKGQIENKLVANQNFTGSLRQAEEIKRPTLLSKPTKDVHLPIEHHLNLNQTTSQNFKDNVPRKVKHRDEKLMVAAQSPCSNTVSFVTHDPKVIERVFYKRDQQQGLTFREEREKEKFTQVVSGWTSSKKSLPETLPHFSKMDPPMQQYGHSKGNFPISKSKSMNIHQCSKTDVAQLDAGASYLPATTFAQQQNPTDEVVSYGLVAGVKFRRGSQDDIALSPNSPPRVRRHASIILLRHSLIETTEGDVAPLSVWGSTQGIQSNSRMQALQCHYNKDKQTQKEENIYHQPQAKPNMTFVKPLKKQQYL